MMNGQIPDLRQAAQQAAMQEQHAHAMIRGFLAETAREMFVRHCDPECSEEYTQKTAEWAVNSAFVLGQAVFPGLKKNEPER